MRLSSCTPLYAVARQVGRAHRALSTAPAPASRAVALPPLSALGGAFALDVVRERHRVMLDAFCDPDVAPLGQWMEVFYRRPHVELLPAVFIEAIRQPGTLTGRQSLSGACFFAEVFKTLCKDTRSVGAVMDCYVAALEVEGLLGGRGRGEGDAGKRAQAAELLDTILRGLWMADVPHLDAYLSATGEEWKAVLGSAEGGAGGGGGGEDGEWTPLDDAALVDSLFPPEGERHRTHILRWPLPSFTLSAFEAHVVRNPFPLYGATRYWFAHTHALRKVALSTDVVKASRLPLLSPLLGQELSRAIVDGVWAYFYATGDAVGAVARVMDCATPYSEFLEEFGDAWVTAYDEKRAPPPSLSDDPLSCMRFEASRYALWTLLGHTRKHTAVGEAFLEQMGKINDTALAVDPMGTEGFLTAFGRARFQLMQALLPSMTALARDASVDGIGSGAYPASYVRLLGGGAAEVEGGGGAPRQVLLEEGAPSPAASAPALESTPVSGGGGAAPGGDHAGASTIADLASRDRRKVGLALRSRRIHGT